nr:DUF4246 family protein [Streptomyces sp. SM10]
MTNLTAFPLPFHLSRSIASATPRTLRELQMLQCSSHIRAKPDWFDKMNDAGIVARWTNEAFAQGPTEAQVRYEQNDDNGVREVYGLEDEDALNQTLGSASTPAGRCLAFPNILQHRVGPIRLTDATRPGHRKILAFFLVDPSERIASTSDVPPQQPWSATSTMTLEQPKHFREELMQERTFFVDEHNEQLHERAFSLYEH